MTRLAFKNAELINLLRQRGAAIKDENWDGMRQIDAQINELKRNKFDEIVTPCSVFMTFQNEEGVNRAKKLDEAIEGDKKLAHLKYWVGDHEIEI